MSTQQIIDNVRASFAMEGMQMTGMDEERGRALVDGKADIEQIISQICEKYSSVSVAK